MPPTAESADFLLINARVATLRANGPAFGMFERGAIAVHAGAIAAVDATDALRSRFPGVPTIDLAGRLVTPGLVDCHTHLIHGGSRAAEFEARLAGASYADIARAGGGILSTVRATRILDQDALVAAALPRLDRLIAEGVTTIEIKSGYGLDFPTEARLLRAARDLRRRRPISVASTYLGAHAVGPEFAGDADAYIDTLCRDWLPELAAEDLIDAVDGFCETIAFSPAQIGRVFAAATALGLRVKLHADQLTDTGGARLAADYRALSADHLEYTDAAGVRALSGAGAVAVLLPGAFYYLHETRKPPIALLRAHGVPMAVATDYNPGTSPITSILAAMNMAAVLFGLTIEECLAGVTRAAAQALGRDAETGTIEPGKSADLAVWDVEAPAELVYRLGDNPLYARFWRGQCPAIV